MYNSQILIENIRTQAKIKNILIRNMLKECGLNVNTISQISDKKGLSSFSLAKIADYLECSVDYLLGRTDIATFEDIAKMNNLNSEGKNMVIEYIRMLSNNDKYIQKPLADFEDGYEIAAFGGKETQGVLEDTEPEITT